MIIEAANRLAHIQEYYFARKLRELRQRIANGEDIINLGIGNPDMNPSEDTLKRLVNAVLEPGVHGYQPYKGVPVLRKAYSEWYFNTYGVSLEAEQEILPLIGSKEGIMHISQAFLNEGDEVLVPNPGYPTYTSVTRLTGASIREYELSAENDWYPDLEALGQTDLSRVKLMWINYPHMPTGALPTEDLFADLIAFGKKHQILICHDNPYSLVLNPRPMSILSVPGAKEVAIELNSLSKSHNMAGWRMGVVVGGADYIQTILRVKSNMDSGMFAPLQQAAVTALNNPYDWHRLRNEEYARRKEIATAILDQLGCSYSQEQGGMFIWAEIPAAYESGEAFSEQILNETQVFLTPGFIFGSAGDRYIRISLCTPPDRLAEALRRIRELSLETNPS